MTHQHTYRKFFRDDLGKEKLVEVIEFYNIVVDQNGVVLEQEEVKYDVDESTGEKRFLNRRRIKDVTGVFEGTIEIEIRPGISDENDYPERDVTETVYDKNKNLVVERFMVYKKTKQGEEVMSLRREMHNLDIDVGGKVRCQETYTYAHDTSSGKMKLISHKRIGGHRGEIGVTDLVNIAKRK